MLSQEVATAMRGRAIEVIIQPFSFRELLTHQKVPVPEDLAALTPAKRSRLEKALADYLVGGGFPETRGLPTSARAQLLQSYVDSQPTLTALQNDLMLIACALRLSSSPTTSLAPLANPSLCLELQQLPRHGSPGLGRRSR